MDVRNSSAIWSWLTQVSEQQSEGRLDKDISTKTVESSEQERFLFSVLCVRQHHHLQLLKVTIRDDAVLYKYVNSEGS